MVRAMAAVVLVTATVLTLSGSQAGPFVTPPAGRSAGPASGPITSSPAASAVWHVVGLGDSVTSGHGCDCDFVADYAALTAQRTGRRVQSANLGADGQTSAQLIDRLTTDASTAGQAGDVRLGRFDDELRALGDNIASIVSLIRGVRGDAATEVLITNYWNVFEDGDRAVARHGSQYLDMARTITDRANDRICSAATANGARCVDLRSPFERAPGGVDTVLQQDGDHPNAAGHALIAQSLAAQGWSDLASS